VPSRTRAFVDVCVLSVCSVGVGDELAIDRVGDPPLQAAHGLHPGLAGGQLAPVVAPAGGVEPDLDFAHRHGYRVDELVEIIEGLT
jgi:hypothetical protein